MCILLPLNLLVNIEHGNTYDSNAGTFLVIIICLAESVHQYEHVLYKSKSIIFHLSKVRLMIKLSTKKLQQPDRVDGCGHCHCCYWWWWWWWCVEERQLHQLLPFLWCGEGVGYNGTQCHLETIVLLVDDTHTNHHKPIHPV